MSNNDSSSRPKRSKKESNIELLSKIKSSRNSGYNYREEFQENDIYEIVTEEVYADKVAERRKNKFVEDESDDDGKEIFDLSDEEMVVADNSKKRKKKRNANISSDSKRLKSEQKPCNIHEMLMKAAPAQQTKPNVDFSDLLESLNENQYTNNIKKKQRDVKAITKPLLKVDTNVFASCPGKSKFKIDSPKAIKTKMNISKNIPVNTKKSISKIKEVIPFIEHSIPQADFGQDESMESWNEEPTLTPVPQKAIVDNNDINDFSDIDFDEPFENNKGFSEVNVKPHAATVMWDEDDTVSIITETCETNMFDEFKDKSKTKVYWIDAYHDVKIPGVVFVFGKTFDENSKCFVNCCIKITGLERRLYFLPKPDCNVAEVHKELKTIFDKYQVPLYRCKDITKKYAFQLAEIPDEAEYLMVLYDGKHPALPSDLEGNTFSHVFGCETSILELLILDLKLKGPSWLSFADLVPTDKKFSSCKLNFELSGIKGVSKIGEKLANPPLTLFSLNIKTVVNSKTNLNEIVSVGCFVHNEVSLDQPPPSKVFQNHFTVLTAPKDSIMPYDLNQKLKTVWGPRYIDSVTVVTNERTLVNNLLTQMSKFDPDLIVGHSLFGNQLQILLQRCQALNISLWHRLGRLTRNIALPKMFGRSTGWLERMATAGRIVCDTEFSGRELVKCRSYELSEMVKNILPENLHGLQNLSELGDLSQCFLNSAGVKNLIDATMDEAISNIYLMHELQILPLAHQITAICGNLIVRTLSAGKSERNEYLLLHAFNEKNYITPDKYVKTKEVKNDFVADDIENENADGGGRRKPTYLGGLVLEPKKGFYENFILLMDFNSLYPSIIQELNICFTTIDRQAYLNVAPSNDDEKIDTPAMDITRLEELASDASTKPLGILPIEIRKLVESRKQVKSLLAEPNLSKEKKMQYDIRQKALKITANSMYGCLGFSHSRFQATQLASLITCKGREILQKTKEMVESGNITYKVNNVPTKLNLEIVYGDTDSVMVNTGLNKLSDFDTVLSFGKRIKEEVNKMYKNIQLDIDGVFRRLLLLKKKKYAALTISKNPETGKIETKQELKGLDIVRRDWCKLAIEVGHNVVTRILEGELSQEDLVVSISEYLSTVKDEVNSGSVDLDKFVITKGLARNPESYTNAKAQAHVQVALRHNKSGATRKFRAQDTVEYIICEDGSDLNPIERAYSPSEVRGSSVLKIDKHYYLSHQLHPVISRQVDGIEGLSPASVAESLGLDSKGYVRHIVKEDMYEDEDRAMSGADKYKGCKPLSLQCLHCKSTNELSSPIATTSRNIWPCSTCKNELVTSATINFLRNTLTKTIRTYSKAYYKSVYVCQELLCGYRVRDVPVVCRVGSNECHTSGGQWLCPHCGQGTMSPVVDHTYLYNQIMFFRALFNEKRKEEILAEVRAHIDNILKKSAYCNVDFSKFAAIFKSKIHLTPTKQNML